MLFNKSISLRRCLWSGLLRNAKFYHIDSHLYYRWCWFSDCCSSPLPTVAYWALAQVLAVVLLHHTGQAVYSGWVAVLQGQSAVLSMDIATPGSTGRAGTPSGTAMVRAMAPLFPLMSSGWSWKKEQQEELHLMTFCSELLLQPQFPERALRNSKGGLVIQCKEWSQTVFKTLKDFQKTGIRDYMEWKAIQNLSPDILSEWILWRKARQI